MKTESYICIGGFVTEEKEVKKLYELIMKGIIGELEDKRIS